MADHSVRYVEKLEKQLRERFDKLLVAVKGRETTEDELRVAGFVDPHRFVIPGDVRVTVDDFATILKEIKASLGKR